jgi:hypothetical protein
LSESIITPSGRKWFFEKSKGEFNTKLRIAGQSGKKRIEKEYPRDFRFTKEELGKYYSSWGDEPYKVKKGGEAIFRKFIEDISIEESKNSLGRNFYEMMIARIILFKSLENIHGSRNNAIGQLRSAVVPYTISIIYSKTEGDKKNPNTFDLTKIWIREGLEDDLKNYLRELMVLVNELIKKYSKSDDLGEYSKKKELWEDIYNSKEIREYLSTTKSEYLFKKYSISKKELEKKLKGSNNKKEVDFKYLTDSVEIHSKTADFYKKIILLSGDTLSENEISKLSNISAIIQQRNEITMDLITFEKTLVQRIRNNNPEIFDNIIADENSVLVKTLNFIIEKYNSLLERDENILSNFDKIGQIAKSKNSKFDFVFKEIGKKLESGISPSFKDIYQASYYVSTLTDKYQNDIE